MCTLALKRSSISFRSIWVGGARGTFALQRSSDRDEPAQFRTSVAKRLASWLSCNSSVFDSRKPKDSDAHNEVAVNSNDKIEPWFNR
jgi:hypothetical protein